MRLWINAAAAAGFCLLSALVLIGGRTVGAPDVAVEVDDIDPAALDDTPAAPAEDAGTSQEGPALAEPEAGSQGADAPLERIAPRPPLSELSQAEAPRPKMPEKWKRITLFQPVAQSAGLIEAKGYRVALSGIDILDVGQSCSYQGRDWDCGTRARTALRAFLRGRAPSCVLPPEPEREIIVAECQVGNQDLAAWLVEQGWAHARADGPYVEAEAAAKSSRRGIYGAPPAEPSLIGATMPAPPGDVDAGIETSSPGGVDTPSIEHLGPPPDAGADGTAATPQVFPPAPSQ